jgi:hypothetical protein
MPRFNPFFFGILFFTFLILPGSRKLHAHPPSTHHPEDAQKLRRANLEILKKLTPDQRDSQIRLYQTRLRARELSLELEDKKNSPSKNDDEKFKDFIFLLEQQIQETENVISHFSSSDQPLCYDYYQNRAQLLRNSLERIFRLAVGSFEKRGAPLRIKKLSPLHQAREALYFETWLLGQKSFLHTLMLSKALEDLNKQHENPEASLKNPFAVQKGEVHQAEFITSVKCLDLSDKTNLKTQKMALDYFKKEFEMSLELEWFIERYFPRTYSGTRRAQKISTVLSQHYLRQESPKTIRVNALVFGANFFTGLGVTKIFSQALASLPKIYAMFFAITHGLSVGYNQYQQDSKNPFELTQMKDMPNPEAIEKLTRILALNRELSSKIPQQLEFWDAYSLKELVAMALFIESTLFDERLAAAEQFQLWCQDYFKQNESCTESQLQSLQLRYERLLREYMFAQ